MTASPFAPLPKQRFAVTLKSHFDHGCTLDHGYRRTGGGVGKTVFSTNVAVYLTALGKRVVLVDADPAGSHAETLLGMNMATVPRANEDTANEQREVPVPTRITGLSIWNLGLDQLGEVPLIEARLAQAMEILDALPVDFVVVDVGTSRNPALLDFYLRGHQRVMITTPEPTAVQSTYQILHALGRRSCVESDTLTGPLVRIVVNQARLRSDFDLGEALRTVARRHLGLWLDYIGYLEFDDAVWTCVRAQKPVLLESPGTKASKAIEKIVRRLLALDSGKLGVPRLKYGPPGSYHELLEVARGSSEEEIRKSYKRMREVYTPDALACYGLLTSDQIVDIRLKLEQAYEVLMDASRRKAYEASVFVDEQASQEQDEDEGIPQSLRPAPPEIFPDTEFTGALLRTVRESQGVELKRISHRTKISIHYLSAIEDEDYKSLPAWVYTRGFVVEYAKHLRLEPTHVSRTYMRRFRRFLESHDTTQRSA